MLTQFYVNTILAVKAQRNIVFFSLNIYGIIKKIGKIQNHYRFGIKQK